MLKLRRLRVEKFRNLAKGAELSFSDGINIVLGQNGTGKTTLLELISMVVRSDFSSLAKEEFAIEYELAAGQEEGLIVRVENARAQPALVGIEERDVFRASMEISGARDRRKLVHFDDERGVSLEGQPPRKMSTGFTPLAPDSVAFCISKVAGFSGWLLSSMPGRAAFRFDEAIGIFGKITTTPDITRKFVVGGRGTVPMSPVSSLVPQELVERLSGPVDPGNADFAFTHKDLNFLATASDMMSFDASQLRVEVTERATVFPSGTLLSLGNIRFRFFWPDGTFITHDRLSYGQKRLLAFFYYLASNPDVVIADELVNGLHHRWITACIEALGQRQAFLTSQNPLLLDYVPITSAEQARKSFVLCRSEPREGPPAWFWENMTEADADELFRAYEVGVEHVSEILQSRGLW